MLQRAAFPGGNAGDTAEPDSAVGDTASDSAAELEETGADPADSGEADTAPAEIQACYLGPARDYSVCLPVVAYDAGLFGTDYEYPDASEGGAAYDPPVRFLDITAFSADLEIAPNFALGEYLEDWKGRYGVMQTRVVDHLQEIRDLIGEPLTVNSGYRNPAYNASIGGADWSRHMYGDGADIQSGSYSVEALGDICDNLGADYVGLYEDGHTHCDWRYSDADPAFFGEVHARPRSPAHAQLLRTAGTLAAPATGFDEGEPFRRWNAYDQGGALLQGATGRTFAPPTETVRVTVRVGGQISLEMAWTKAE